MKSGLQPHGDFFATSIQFFLACLINFFVTRLRTMWTVTLNTSLAS